MLGCQYFQNTKGKIEIRIVPSSSFTGKEKQKFIKNVKSRLGVSMEVEVVLTDNLVRSKSGKVRQAICTIGKEQ